jgi:hypothetical protein
MDSVYIGISRFVYTSASTCTLAISLISHNTWASISPKALVCTALDTKSQVLDRCSAGRLPLLLHTMPSACPLDRRALGCPKPSSFFIQLRHSLHARKSFRACHVDFAYPSVIARHVLNFVLYPCSWSGQLFRVHGCTVYTIPIFPMNAQGTKAKCPSGGADQFESLKFGKQHFQGCLSSCAQVARLIIYRRHGTGPLPKVFLNDLATNVGQYEL